MGGHNVDENITCFLHMHNEFVDFSSISLISAPLHPLIDLIIKIEHLKQDNTYLCLKNIKNQAKHEGKMSIYDTHHTLNLNPCLFSSKGKTHIYKKLR